MPFLPSGDFFRKLFSRAKLNGAQRLPCCRRPWVEARSAGAHSPCLITFVSSARTRVSARLYSPRKNARTSRFCIRARPWSCRNRRKMNRALAPAALFRRSRRLFPQAVRSLERARSGTPPRPNTPPFPFDRQSTAPPRLANQTRLPSPKPAPVPFLSSFHHLPKVTFSDNTPLTRNHIWPVYSLRMIF